MRKQRGFTLVELLVVIGIIAVLISILLPSLAKAKQYANSLKCMTNLRSIGQGLFMYAQEYKGKLPQGYDYNNFFGDMGNNWVMKLQPYLGAKVSVSGWWVNGNISQSFLCPDVNVADFNVSQVGGLSCYTGNCRAFSDAWIQKNYPLATKKSAEKMLAWDGGILFHIEDWGAPYGFSHAAYTNEMQMGGNWSKWPGYDTYTMWSDPQDLSVLTGSYALPLTQIVHLGSCDGAYGTGHWNTYIDPNPASVNYIGKNNNDSMNNAWERSFNIPDSYAFQRYRHLGNTSCNFLFFDGHVEPRKLGTVTVGDLSAYPF